MPVYRVTVTRSLMISGTRLEKGMTVDVVTNYLTNPLTTGNGQAVIDAFARLYSIDLRQGWLSFKGAMQVTKVG